MEHHKPESYGQRVTYRSRGKSAQALGGQEEALRSSKKTGAVGACARTGKVGEMCRAAHEGAGRPREGC